MFEYKVVPAPTKGQKSKGVKSAEDRFAFALETVMNDLAAEGWEYLRADTLPSVERAGLTGSTTEWRNLLVFRRSLGEAAAEPTPEAAVEAPRIEARPEPKFTRTLPGPDKADVEPRDPPLTADADEVRTAPPASRRFALVKSPDTPDSD